MFEEYYFFFIRFVVEYFVIFCVLYVENFEIILYIRNNLRFDLKKEL